MILVTGGAGFIGSHVVDALVASGQEVRVLDLLLASAHAGPPDYLNGQAEFIQGDVGDPGCVARALVGVDAVCHQAAMVGLGADFADVTDYVRHNDLATAVLLRAMAAARFSGRLVLASSMVVYGEGGYRCARHGRVRPPARAVADLRRGRFEPPCPRCGDPLEPVAVPEAARLDPRNVYAATKLHQEQLCRAFGRERGVSVTALRYHNVYGPRMPRDTPYAGVASIFMSALAAGRAPAVFEDGRQLRDFVHVRDVARANQIALTRPQPQDGAYNVCSGQPRSIGQMARSLASAAAASSDATAAREPRVTGEFRLGDVRHVFASAELAAADLGFTAIEDFDAGMREFAAAPQRSQPPPGTTGQHRGTTIRRPQPGGPT